MKLFGAANEEADGAPPQRPGRGRADFTEQLNRGEDDNEYSTSPPRQQQPMTIKKRISSLVRGPNQGQQTRQQASAKKVPKRPRLECTEEEIEANWTAFKSQLDEIYSPAN